MISRWLEMLSDVSSHWFCRKVRYVREGSLLERGTTSRGETVDFIFSCTNFCLNIYVQV